MGAFFWAKANSLDGCRSSKPAVEVGTRFRRCLCQGRSRRAKEDRRKFDALGSHADQQIAHEGPDTQAGFHHTSERIKVPGSLGEIRDDQGRDHAGDSRSDGVELLHAHNVVGIPPQREKYSTQDQRGKGANPNGLS
jgi:hypothetical protein